MSVFVCPSVPSPIIYSCTLQELNEYLLIWTEERNRMGLDFRERFVSVEMIREDFMEGTAFDLGLVRYKWLGHERGGGGGGGKAFKKEVSAGAKAGTPGHSMCFHVAAVQGTLIVWWQIKEGLECQSKVCGFYSEARGRQWSDMSRALLQEDKSVTNFKMFWSEEKLLWGGECS